MSFRIEREGSKWLAFGDTQTDLQTAILALKTVLDGENNHAARRGRPPSNGTTQVKEKEERRKETALTMLRAINQAGSIGADSSALLKAGGITNGKGLGPIMRMVNKIIAQLSFRQEAVYGVTSPPNKRWIARAEISAVIKKLEETMAQNQQH